VKTLKEIICYILIMDNIKLYKPRNKSEATDAISAYVSEISKLQKLFGIDGKKHCAICKEDKPIEQFHAKQSKCKDCSREYFRIRYHEREKMKKEKDKKPTTTN